MSTLLVLTASVRPAHPGELRRSDPLRRQEDYCAALRNWCAISREEVDLDILFCDNSGWELEPIRAAAAGSDGSGRLELRQIGPIDYPRRLGKGFGEAAIVDHVIANELAGRNDVEFVAKCTGRLFVKNCVRILRRLGPDTDLVCALDGKLRFADSRFFVARREVFASAFAGLGAEIDESRGIYFEHALLRRALRAVADGARWEPFAVLPLFAGRSATDGTRYDGPRELAEWLVRSGLRAAALRARMQI